MSPDFAISCCLFIQWIFWVGPFIGAALATLYHQIILRAIPFRFRPWDCRGLPPLKEFIMLMYCKLLRTCLRTHTHTHIVIIILCPDAGLWCWLQLLIYTWLNIHTYIHLSEWMSWLNSESSFSKDYQGTRIPCIVSPTGEGNFGHSSLMLRPNLVRSTLKGDRVGCESKAKKKIMKNVGGSFCPFRTRDRLKSASTWQVVM